MRDALLASLLLLAQACSGTTEQTSTLPTNDQSLYSQLGGVEALRVLVDEWIAEVSTDPRIREFFASSDMSILKLRLLERVCVLVEGPCVYKGRDLYEAHAHLRLEDRHLSAFLEGLEPAIERAKLVGEPAQELRVRLRGLAAELAIAVGE